MKHACITVDEFSFCSGHVDGVRFSKLPFFLVAKFLCKRGNVNLYIVEAFFQFVFFVFN